MTKFAPKIEVDSNIKVPNLGVGDVSSKSLFEQVGTVLGQGSQIADGLVQRKIEKEARGIFDEANAPFDTLIGDLPTEIKNSEGNLSRIQTAFEQGKLSDTAYYSKLVAGTKSLKSKFPGYTGEIDNIIQKVTGVRPANALRNAALAQLNKAATSEQKKQDDFFDFLSKQGNMEALQGKYPDVLSNPDRYLQDDNLRQEVLNHVVSYHGEKAKIDDTLKKLTLDEKVFQENQRVVEGKINQYLGAKVTESISGLNTVLKNEYNNNIYEMLAKGVEIPPAELQALLGQLNGRRNSLYAQLQSEIISNSNGMISQTELKAQMDAAFIPMDDLISSITNKEFGIAGIASRTAEHIQDLGMLDLLKSSGSIRFYHDLGKISPELRDQFLLSEAGGHLQTSIQNTLSSIAMQNMLDSTTSLSEEMGMIITNGSASSDQKAVATLRFVDNIATQLGDAKGDRNVFAEVFDKTYSDQDIFKHLGNQSQVKVFNKLTNPKITNRIMASGDTEMINKYVSWVKTQPKLLGDFRILANDVNSIRHTREFLDAEINEKGELVVSIDEAKFDEFASGANVVPRDEMTTAIQKTLNNITTFNNSLENVRKVLSANGDDLQEEMEGIISDTIGDIDAREDSWFQWVADIIGSGPQISTGDESSVTAKKSFQKWFRENPEFFSLENTSFKQGEEKAPSVKQSLMRDLGLEDHIAAGIVGNLQHESGNFKSLQEKNPLVKGSRGGFGWAQWTGPRRKAFEKWAKERNLDVTSDAANYGFLLHELTQTGEKKVLKALQRTKTAEEAAEIFSNVFLRPGIPHMSSRKRFAKKLVG